MLPMEDELSTTYNETGPDKCRRHILTFTKYPQAGYAKTRLISMLGEGGAAAVSKQLTERCVGAVRRYAKEQHDGHKIQSVIHYTGIGIDMYDMESWLGKEEFEEYVAQSGGDLGMRLSDAFKRSFQAGANRVVVIGSDIPEIDEQVIQNAFEALENHDVVVGPAQDGGYYLLGMRSFFGHLFDNVPWSTKDVFAVTKSKVESCAASMKVLNTLRDIDFPHDLEYFNQVLAKGEKFKE